MAHLYTPLRVYLLSFLLLTIAAGCSSTNSPQTTKQSILKADTSAIDFGSVLVDSVATSFVRISNPGNDTLHISSFYVQNTTATGKFDAKDSASRSLPIAVAPNDSMLVRVTFLATLEGACNGSLTLISSDAGVSQPSIMLHATGVSWHVTRGSSYSYLTTSYNGGGNQTDQTQRNLLVISADTTYRAKAHAYELAHDTVENFYSTESGGDIGYYYPSSPTINSIGAEWVTLPFGSKTTIIRSSDTEAYTISGVTFNIHYSKRAEWIGLDSMVVAGRLLHVNVARLTVVYDLMDIPTIGSGTVTTTQNFYYSSRIGTFVRRDITLATTLPPSLLSPGSTTEILTNFTVK